MEMNIYDIIKSMPVKDRGAFYDTHRDEFGQLLYTETTSIFSDEDKWFGACEGCEFHLKDPRNGEYIKVAEYGPCM